MFALQFLLFVIFSVCSINVVALSQTTVDIKLLRTPNITIDTSEYPKLSAWLKVVANGNPYLINKTELSIIESNRSTQPIAISSLDAQGYQRVTWYTRSEGANVAEFIATVNNSTATVKGLHDRGHISQVRFCDAFGNQVKEFNFGALLPGQSDYTTLLIRAVASKMNERGIEVATQLDSITFSSPDFSYRWIGSFVSTQKPPVGLSPAVGYFFDVVFTPSRSGYYKEYAVLHYEGGQKEYLFLRANGFELQEQQNLTLIDPNNATILTPCEFTTIKWKGYRIGAPTFVDWSPDGGKTWDTIGSSMDSTLLWKTPGTITDSGRIRIRQELGRFEEKLLLNPNLKGGVTKIAWNALGDALLAGYDNGKIGLWDKVNASLLDTFVIEGIQYPLVKTLWLGHHFLSDSTFFTAYRVQSTGEEYLRVYQRGNNTPILSKPITMQGSIKHVMLGSDQKSVLIIPLRGNTIERYSLVDGSVLPSIVFSSPITAFSNGNGKLGSIALLDGTIALLNMNDLSVVNTINNPALPLASRLTVSDDGKLLGMGTMLSEQSTYSSSTSEVHVLDIASESIVRSLRNSSSDVVGLSFNSTNQFLATGFAGLPQISVWKIPTNTFLGTVSGHLGFLTDIQYSPDGTSIASSAITNDNLKVMDFAYPEKDTSDAYISIVPSQPRIINAIIKPVVLMHQIDSILTVNVCNAGKGNILIDYAYFREGEHFSLAQPIPNTIAIKPGECIDVHVRVQTKDIGLLKDTLFFGYCSQEFFMPIEVYSEQRNIAITGKGSFLGSLCINESLIKEIDLVRNDDSVPLTINRIVSSKPNVTIVSSIKDTVLKPGQTLSVLLQYSPKGLGEELIDIAVFHSGLDRFEVYCQVKGEGIGADITVPTFVPFIPEQTKRTITITNSSMNEVQLVDISIPSGNAKLLSALPKTIQSKKSVEIEIEVIGQLPDSGIQAFCSFTPCASAKIITLIPYSATAQVSMPLVEADPRGRTEIPVSILLNEKIPYNEKALSLIAFAVNPRIFLPDSVLSQYGSVAIIGNSVINDQRIISISFDGKMPKSGVLFTLFGYAGIAEQQQSPLELQKATSIISSRVIPVLKNGMFTLINLCKDITFVQDSMLFEVHSLHPNPAQERVQVHIRTTIDDNIQYRIIDNIGTIIQTGMMSSFTGESIQVLDLSGAIASGTYSLQWFTKKHGILANRVIHILQ